MKELSENLKRLRESQNISKSELGRLLNITPTAYAVYETGVDEIGDREPKLKNLIKLADFFNVSVDELLNHNVDEFKRCKDLWESAGFEVYQENEKVILKKPFKEKQEMFYPMFEDADLLEVPEDKLIFDNKEEFLGFSKKAKLIFQKETKKKFKNFAKILFVDITYKIAFKQETVINSNGTYHYSALKNK